MKASISFSRLAIFFFLMSLSVSPIPARRFGLHLLEIDAFEHLADRLRADQRGERVGAVFLLRLEILVLGQELAVLERGQARLEHDVVFEIEDALEVLQRHVEQQADAARQRLEEPDMGNRRRQLDMAHALAPHAGQRDLDRALLADDALVLHALVLAAQALVVLDRPEDARAEQAVALGLEGAVVDRLRLFDLAVGPRQNLLRARDRDPDLVEDLSRGLRAEEIHNFLVHRILRLPTSVGRCRKFFHLPRHGRARSGHLAWGGNASVIGMRGPGPPMTDRVTPPLPPSAPGPAGPAWNCAGRH